jgi:hypothetical protein
MPRSDMRRVWQAVHKTQHRESVEPMTPLKMEHVPAAADSVKHSIGFIGKDRKNHVNKL